MYRNAYQRGMLSIFFSVGSKPLSIWDTYIKDGYISRFLDQDIKSMVLEIGGTNVSTTYIICPKGKAVLGISMPFLVMIIKNLKKYFSFEVTILDETGTRRRFRVSNFQSSTQILPLCTVMPIGLSEGWNQIQFNLAEFTRRAYQKQFVEVQKVKINANVRLRRIYFADRLIPEDELPPEYKLYFPIAGKGAKPKKTIENVKDQEILKPSSSQQTAPQPGLEGIKEGSKVSIHSVKKGGSKESKISNGYKEMIRRISEVQTSKSAFVANDSATEGEKEYITLANEEKSQQVVADAPAAPDDTEAVSETVEAVSDIVESVPETDIGIPETEAPGQVNEEIQSLAETPVDGTE